jgi:PAS domain S-box-containing protein
VDAGIAFGALLLAAFATWYAARFEERAESLEDQVLAERSYEVFIDNAIEGFFRTTFAGKYMKVNRALAEVYGYDSPEQLMSEITDIGKTLYVDPRQRTAFQDFMKRDGYVHDFVSEIHRRDGKKIWIAENARSVCDADGQVFFMRVPSKTSPQSTRPKRRFALP